MSLLNLFTIILLKLAASDLLNKAALEKKYEDFPVKKI